MLSYSDMGQGVAPVQGVSLAELRKAVGVSRTRIQQDTGITPTTQRKLESSGTGYRLVRYRSYLEDQARRVTDRAVPPTSIALPPSESSTGSPYERLLHLILQPELWNDAPLFPEERVLLEVLREATRTPAQRCRILSIVFGLLADRLERGNDDATPEPG